MARRPGANSPYQVSRGACRRLYETATRGDNGRSSTKTKERKKEEKKEIVQIIVKGEKREVVVHQSARDATVCIETGAAYR